MCVCADGAVCGSVYPGALGATQCVCMSVEVGDGLPEVKLYPGPEVEGWAVGFWPRVPSSAPSLQSPSGPRGRIQRPALPWFRPSPGTHPLVSLSVCLFVWLLSETAFHLPCTLRSWGCSGCQVEVHPSGHRQRIPGPRCITCRGSRMEGTPLWG